MNDKKKTWYRALCAIALASGLFALMAPRAQAYTNFISDPYSLVPPGCVTVPAKQERLYGDNVARVAHATVELDSMEGDKPLPVEMEIYRVACAEPGRSAIWMVISPLDYDCNVYRAPAPGMLKGIGWHSLRMSREPGTWSVGQGDRDKQVFGGEVGPMGCQSVWPFLLDGGTLLSSTVGYPDEPTVEDYNGEFEMKVWLRDNPDGIPPSITFNIPSTESVLEANPRMPLHGRLSGNWIVAGAADQGFMISVNEGVPDSIPILDVPPGFDFDQSRLVLFLSWYTFDPDGDLLWLTGAATFAIGATELTVPIERVSDGQFLGSRTADREVVGSVKLTARGCNDLSMEYELDALGLGRGTEQLNRPHGLETAGYVCRDLRARIESRTMR